MWTLMERAGIDLILHANRQRALAMSADEPEPKDFPQLDIAFGHFQSLLPASSFGDPTPPSAASGRLPRMRGAPRPRRAIPCRRSSYRGSSPLASSRRTVRVCI